MINQRSTLVSCRWRAFLWALGWSYSPRNWKGANPFFDLPRVQSMDSYIKPFHWPSEHSVFPLLQMAVSQLVSPICEAFASPPSPARVDLGYFAFAYIRGVVNLVQGIFPSVSSLTLKLKYSCLTSIFCHANISIDNSGCEDISTRVHQHFPPHWSSYPASRRHKHTRVDWWQPNALWGRQRNCLPCKRAYHSRAHPHRSLVLGDAILDDAI